MPPATRCLTSMNFDFSCDIGHIQLEVPHQIWELTTAHGLTNPLLVRFLYNKPSFYATDLLRCYVHYLSPEFLNETFTIFGLILFGLGLWHLIIHKKWLIIAFLAVAPLSPLFDTPSDGVLQTVILYSALILVMLFGVKNLWDYFFS